MRMKISTDCKRNGTKRPDTCDNRDRRTQTQTSVYVHSRCGTTRTHLLCVANALVIIDIIGLSCGRFLRAVYVWQSSSSPCYCRVGDRSYCSEIVALGLPVVVRGGCDDMSGLHRFHTVLKSEESEEKETQHGKMKPHTRYFVLQETRLIWHTKKYWGKQKQNKKNRDSPYCCICTYQVQYVPVSRT